MVTRNLVYDFNNGTKNIQAIRNMITICYIQIRKNNIRDTKRYKQYKKIECFITSGTRFVLEFIIENVIVGTEWKRLTVARVWVRGQAVRRCPPSFALGSLDCHSSHVVGVGDGAAAAAFPWPADAAAAYCQTDHSCRSLSDHLAF